MLRQCSPCGKPSIAIKRIEVRNVCIVGKAASLNVTPTAADSRRQCWSVPSQTRCLLPLTFCDGLPYRCQGARGCGLAVRPPRSLCAGPCGFAWCRRLLRKPSGHEGGGAGPRAARWVWRPRGLQAPAGEAQVTLKADIGTEADMKGAAVSSCVGGCETASHRCRGVRCGREVAVGGA